MSFDLYFVPDPGPGQDCSFVMEQLESLADEERPASAEDRELWDRIVAAVNPAMPTGEVFEHERFCELSDDTGLQLHMHPGEISLSVPYWSSGEEAERVVDRLKVVAAAVEGATGLVAYDPQADTAFLTSGAAAAPATFDRVDDFMTNELGARPVGSATHPRWAFWRR